MTGEEINIQIRLLSEKILTVQSMIMNIAAHSDYSLKDAIESLSLSIEDTSSCITRGSKCY